MKSFHCALGKAVVDAALERLLPIVFQAAKTLAPYFTLFSSNAFPQKAFEAVYGGNLPENQSPQKGAYTINTPIGDMSDSFIGRMLYKMMVRTVRNMFKNSDEDNPLLGMVENMFKEMPLRSMLMMSNGALKRETLDGLLLMINGLTIRGTVALVRSFFA